MTVRPLRLIGDPVLRTPCDRVVRFDDALAKLVADLLDTVRLPGRAGLAANQVGSSLAVFAYNVDGRLGYVINPVLAETSGEQDGGEQDGGEQDGGEACLSIPGVSASRCRAAHAVVTGVDLEQRPVTVARGRRARALPPARDRSPARRALHRRAHRPGAPAGHARDPGATARPGSVDPVAADRG
ncbi:MAG TPA: peptide deformylase [Streptosporangiaceae bacterium]|nr:peptide deformylase [Streptosporangiaceae bacterium]